MGSPHCDFIDSWGSTAQQLNKNTFHNGRKMAKDQKEQMRKMEQCRPNHGSHVPVWVVDFPVTLERNETCWGGGLLVLSFRDEHWQCLPRFICAWHCSILECVCMHGQWLPPTKYFSLVCTRPSRFVITCHTRCVSVYRISCQCAIVFVFF